MEQSRVILGRVLDRFDWLRWCLCVLLLIFYPGRLVSQTATDAQGETKPLHFDFTPLIGYRTGMNFLTGQNVQVTSPHLTLDPRASYGAAGGVRLDEENLVEFRWARQYSRIHLEGSTPPLSSQKVILDQFHGDFTHEYFMDGWPDWARPFVIGSVGATHIHNRTGSFTRFSFGLGGGMKVYFTRHFGWRVQGEWLPVVINPEVKAFVCGGGCIAHLSATLVSQGEVLVGPVFRF